MQRAVLTIPAVIMPPVYEEISAQLHRFDCGLDLAPGTRVVVYGLRGQKPLLPHKIRAAVELHGKELAVYLQQIVVIGADPAGTC